MSDRIVKRYLYDRLLEENGRLVAEIVRLIDYLTARIERNHKLRSSLNEAGNVVDGLTAELEKVRVERDFYHQQVITLVDDFNNGKTLKWAEKAIEEIEQDAFNSGRDVQHRIDGRESAGFAELEY